MRTAPISVIIPAFNAGLFIEQAVESVLAQTIRPSQIIVVDDGSVDDTRERLAPFLGEILYLWQPNQGVSVARNLGLFHASEEYVAFLDADDFWHPQKIEVQLRVMAAHPDLALLSTSLFDWPTEQLPAIGNDRGNVAYVSWSQLVVKNHLNTSSILLRRSVQLRAGFFDPDIQGPEDRDLWLRVAEIAPVANLDLPLTGYREVQGSVSKQAARCERGMLRILQKLDGRGALSGRRVLRRKAYSYVYHICSHLHSASGRPLTGIWNELQSFLWYPLPFGRDVSPTRFARVKRVMVDVLRLLKLKSAG